MRLNTGFSYEAELNRPGIRILKEVWKWACYTTATPMAATNAAAWIVM
jgi:hypothetical protein